MTAYSKSFVGGRPARLGTETFTDNGTYVAIDFQNSQGKALDGFSSVVVNLPLGAKTITANGAYSASDDSLKGYSSLSVNVPPNVGEVSFSQNGEYLASDYKLQGFSKVTLATPYEELFSATGNITTLDLYITAARSKCFYGYDSLQSLVLRNGAALLPTIQAALPTDLAQGTNLTIYVPETSVADYSALYSAYYTIKPLTEYGRYWYDIVTAATVLTSNLYITAIQAFADTKDPYDGLRIPANITSIYSGALTPITDPASALKIHDLDFEGTIAAFGTSALTAIDANFANAGCPISIFRYKGSSLLDTFFVGSKSIKEIRITGNPNNLGTKNCFGENIELIEALNYTGNILYFTGSLCYTNSYTNSTLKKVNAPKATGINALCFCNCKSLLSANIDGITRLKGLEFQNCTALETATASSVTTIAGNGGDFAGCTSLKDCNMKSWDGSYDTRNYITGMFSGDTNLVNVDLTAMKSIPNATFSGCSKLTSSGIKTTWANITGIGNNAFNGCISIGYLDFSDNASIPTLGTGAFAGITNLKIRVPYSLIASWWSAANWSALTSFFVGVLKADAAVTLDAIKIIDGIQYTVTWYANPDLTGTAVSGDQPAGTYYAKLSV